jgi:acetyl-CoA carboxylase carboxyl transferase subunit alpha
MPQESPLNDHLDFERPIRELEERIAELQRYSSRAEIDLTQEIVNLRSRCEKLKREIFISLTPWQRVLLARHPDRPETMDYIGLLVEDFVELHGDRAYADDRAIVCGFGKIASERVMLIGHRRGKTTKERVQCNFGSPHPEGYRKALLKMQLAEKLRLPIVSFVNTLGAYPGIGAEERGQSHAIAMNLLEMSRLRVPFVSFIIGEGGSGGALALCVADRLSILENAYFSVITPEGCAAILWRDGTKAPQAADVLKLTPKDLLQLGVVDEVIPEPLGGAHRDPEEMARILQSAILRYLAELKSIPVDRLLELRYEKYRRIGQWIDPEVA